MLLAGCRDAAPTVTPAGLSSGAEASATPAAATTAKPLSGEISFLVFGEPAEAKAFVDVAKGFQDANPEVKVNTEAVPSQPNHLLKLATAFAWCIARTNVPCKRVLEGLRRWVFPWRRSRARTLVRSKPSESKTRLRMLL